MTEKRKGNRRPKKWNDKEMRLISVPIYIYIYIYVRRAGGDSGPLALELRQGRPRGEGLLVAGKETFYTQKNGVVLNPE